MKSTDERDELRCSGNQNCWERRRCLRCCPGALPVHQGHRGPGRSDGLPQVHGILRQALRLRRHDLHLQGDQQPPDHQAVQPS